jgi:hypothetical protein
MENYILEIKGYIEDLELKLKNGNFEEFEKEELEWNLEGWIMELERLEK